MIGYTAHVRLSVSLLAGLLVGCAPSSRPSDGATEPAPQPDTTPIQEDTLPAPGTVTSEEIRRGTGESIESILEGRIAGVTVIRAPGGGIAVRIRGFTSILGNNEPLYVIDGIPLNPGPGGNLSGLSPYDIESIEVLKDPVSLSLYGVRGANGIVVITTKRPGKK